MAEKKDQVKYKYGENEIDLKNYIDNLSSNVSSYLEDRIKRGGWTQEQVDEFTNSYNRYEKAFKDQLGSNSGRFYTTSLGQIYDTNGEFNNTDDDGIDPVGSQWYYDNKGRRITSDDYAMLKDKDKKNYKAFNANREVATYFKKVGDYLNKKIKATPTTKYDEAKHGWNYWWGHIKNQDGGTNLTPYLDLDPVDANGKRQVKKRASEAAKWVKEYSDWLSGQDLDFSQHSITYDDKAHRLNALSEKWADEVWDANDLILAAQAGIGRDWTDKFFTLYESPDMTDAQYAQNKADQEQAKKDAELAKKDADAAAAEKADAEAWDTYIKDQLNLYDKNKGVYYSGGESSYSMALPDTDLETALSSLSTDNNTRNSQFKNFYNNPFYNQYADPVNGANTMKLRGNILWLLINQGRAQALEDGSYYLPYDPDTKLGRALVYDPSRQVLEYRFVGDIPQLWDSIRRNHTYNRHPERRYEQYRKEGGTITKLQFGGDFDYALWTEGLRNQHLQQKAEANGTTVARQEAKDRQVSDGLKGHNETDFMHQKNEGFTAVDKAHLISAGADIISLISAFAPGYGTAVSAVSGFGSTAINFGTDLVDDSVSVGEALWSGAKNLGMDLLGLIPGGGSASKGAKIAKNMAKLTSKMLTAFAAMGAFENREAIIASVGKLRKGETMTVGDWQNVVQGISVITGIGAGTMRHATKNTDAYNPKRYNRKDGKVVDDKVAMEFTNTKTGKKETRVFTGDDALAIRTAQQSGDIEALRGATVKKYEDLSHLDVSLHGQRPTLSRGEGQWFPRFRTTEGQPAIYDIKTDAHGRSYVDRGSGVFSYQSDIYNTQRLNSTNGRTIAEADNIVKTDADVAEAMRYTTARDKFETGTALARQRESIKTKVLEKKRALDTFKSEHPTPTPDELNTINQLQSQIDQYTRMQLKLNNFDMQSLRQRSKASERLELRQDANGNISFQVTGGDPVTRNWRSIMDKFNIKYRQGGKVDFFIDGGTATSLRNTQAPNGEIDWFAKMFSHKTMADWFDTMDATKPETYQKFNELLAQWHTNLTSTGYDPSKPDEAKKGVHSNVSTRQAMWNRANNTNQAIEELRASGNLVGLGGTNDTKAGGYIDNWFGRQEYLRHGGTRESWQGHETELAEFTARMKAKGFNYHLGNDGMYYLDPLDSETPYMGRETTKEEKPVVKLNEVTTPETPAGITSPQVLEDKLTKPQKTQSTIGGKVFMDPRIRAIANNAYANVINAKMTQMSIDAEQPVYPEDYELHRYLQGDLDSLMAGKAAAGKLMQIASHPITSDGRLYTASMNDAAAKGLESINEGRNTDNQALRTSKEAIWTEDKENVARRNAVAFAARKEGQEVIENKVNKRLAQMAKKYANDEVLAQEIGARDEMDLNTYKARKEAYDKYDILNAVRYNLSKYADLTPEEERAWNILLSGDMTYTELASTDPEAAKAYLRAQAKEQQALQEQFRLYYGVPTSKWTTTRTISTSIATDDSPYPGFTPVHKKGGTVSDDTKLAIARMRERSKDADRVSKRHKQALDRSEKSLERLQKRMYKHNEYPLTKKK